MALVRIRRFLALTGAFGVLGLIAAGGAQAAGTRVSVRVEGVKHTLLRARTVTAPARGFVSRGHSPRRACPAHSAAGALNRATHGRWGGTYSNGLGIELTRILGERHTFTSGRYWGFWVNGRYAQSGICALKPHRGDKLLFAAVPTKATHVYPIAISAPRHATAHRPFTVKVSYDNARGRSKPLSGARINGHAVTNAHGLARITPSRAGKLTLKVSRHGYIRDEATVAVRRPRG